MTRVALWAGRSGPGRASAGALIDADGASAETVRRAVLACGVALAAEGLAAASPGGRDAVARAFADTRPDDLVDLTGPCTIGGLAVAGPGGAPPLDAAVAEMTFDRLDDPDDIEPRVLAGGMPADEAAALAAAAMARALPRDPLHLARVGASLRALSREATLYPETLPSMAAGIAVTSRDDDAVRMFTDAVVDSHPRDERRSLRLPEGRTATIAAAVAVVGAGIGMGIAAGLLWLLDPAAATANRTTALVAGALIGGAIATGIAVRLLSRLN